MSLLGVQYAQKPIRLQLSVVSNPPAPLLDANTGEEPRLYRGYPVAVQIGIFDAQQNPVDLSNLSQLQVVLMEGPLSPVSVASVAVAGANIATGISWEDWQQGIAQNATALLTAASTDQSLGGGTTQEYWLAVIGITTGGGAIVYGAGYVTLYNPGNSLPFLAPGLVDFNAQTINGSATFQVTPGAQVHLEKIAVGNQPGAARCVVGAVGLVAGARVDLRFNLPSVAGTTIDVYDQSLVGSDLCTVYSDPSGYTPTALVQLYFDGTNLQRLATIIPANGQQS